MEAGIFQRGGPEPMTVVFFLEEPSAREMLKGFLPRTFPGITDVTYIVFEGRQDLEKHLVR